MSDPIYKGATTIGNGRSPVVIDTSGKVVIKVREKYFPLNFQDTQSAETTSSKEESSSVAIEVILQSEIQSLVQKLTEDTLIVTNEGQIYLFSNGELVNLQAAIPASLELTSLTVSNQFAIKNNKEVSNLNANYLQGRTANEFGQVNRNTTIKSPWNFQSPMKFKTLEGKYIYIGGDDGIIRVPTLYVDNLISGDYTEMLFTLHNKPVVISSGACIVEDYTFKLELPDGEEGFDVSYDSSTGITSLRCTITYQSNWGIKAGDMVQFGTNNGDLEEGYVEGIPDYENKMVISYAINEAFPEDSSEQESFLEKHAPSTGSLIITRPDDGIIAGNVGPLKINIDGSASIGNNDNKIYINSSGEVTLGTHRWTDSTDNSEKTENITAVSLAERVRVLEEIVKAQEATIKSLQDIHNL